ncbi:random slug protein 5-like [Chenopodium quinoa]|uniref:CRAL-TRIO domain-containing protein n=1 Tax=Chenopodium quinoa TaxID=63459 RepID=A0A803NDJ6_CHEQI|nr:random slug protein 5-like [Chenopodium quinoa]
MEDTGEGSDVKEIIQGKENTAEQHKLSLMRAFIECRDPSSKEVDDLTLRRFLRARDLDVEKAGAMFLKYLKWRKTFIPNGYVSESEIQNELSQNKAFVGGNDKKGRPILVVLARRHFQNTTPGGSDEFKQFAAYVLDKICTRMPLGQEKFCAIGDLQGWGYSNSDIRGYLGALSILQDCYPERLGKLFIVHAPRIFMAVWKIIYPFIDDNTKTKIVFVEKRQLTSTMLEDIDESQLPDIYGGKLPLKPIQVA